MKTSVLFILFISTLQLPAFVQDPQWGDPISISLSDLFSSSNPFPQSSLEKAQYKSTQIFKRKFLSPWSQPKPKTPPSFQKKRYSVNLIPFPFAEINRINTTISSMKKMQQKAITTRITHCRHLPTHRPGFINPKKAGQGFPFDMFQETSLYPNTPLYIWGCSSDGKWFYAQTPYGYGWILSHDVTFISDDIESLFYNNQWGTFISDNYPLKSTKNNIPIFHCLGKIGMIAPILETSKDQYHIALIQKQHQTSDILSIIIPTDTFTPIPYPLSPNHKKTILKALLNEPYGWGGLWLYRDCSMTTRDFFIPFGIFLERNSSQQGHTTDFKRISLKGMNRQKKINCIKKNATPFLSLIYLKGHIALYCGLNSQGEIVIFHNIFGLKIINKGKEDRFIIGKAILSSLFLGKKLKNTQKDQLLIDRSVTLVNWNYKDTL